MLNSIYYENDNILNSISVDSDNTIYNNTSISFADNTYYLNYNSKYPSLLDGNFIDSTSIVINSNNIEILTDEACVVEIPLYDYYMNIYCNDLCNDDKKYLLKNFNLIIGGDVNSVQYDNAIYINKYKNLVTGNIIYDYILDTEETFSYNNLKQDIVEKEEFVGYIDNLFFPEYSIKCTDSSNNVKYYRIDLVDLGYPKSSLLSSTFYDTTTIEYNNYSDNIQTNILNLPKLIKSKKFRSILLGLQAIYSDIKIIFNIKNQSLTDNLKINDADFYFNQYMGCKFIFDLNINNINKLVNNSEWYLNRGAFLKYDSQELENYYSTDVDRINFYLNSTELDYNDSIYDKSLLISKNYITYNNYIPLELYNDRSNKFIIELKDLSIDKEFVLDENIKLTLMRQLVSFSNDYVYYNTNEKTEVDINDFGYVYTSTDSTIIKKNINTDYLVSSVFNTKSTTTTALLINDVTSLYEEIGNSYTINIFYKKINRRNTILYIQYSSSDIINHLYKFFQNNEIDLVINNIVVSIMEYNYETGYIENILYPLTTDNLVQTYNDSNTVTYIFKIVDKDIIKINNIFNRSIIDKYYYQDSTTEYYLPNDVVQITDNKK